MKITIKTKEIEFEWSQEMDNTAHSELTNSDNSNARLLEAIYKIIECCTKAHSSILEKQIKTE